VFRKRTSTVAVGLVALLALTAALAPSSAAAGGSADVQLTVQLLLSPPENHPPVAVTTGPYSTNVGQAVQLSGSPSYDPDPGDMITAYEWDLDNNGSFETTGMHVGATFNQAGTFTVRLRVTDSHHASDVAETTVAVTDIYAVDYKYTSRRRIDRYVIQLGLAVKCRNDSQSVAKNVRLTLTGVPASYTVIDNAASLGDIPAGQEKWSPDDSVIIRQDRRVPVQPDEQFIWTLEFDDASGAHHTVTSLTQAR